MSVQEKKSTVGGCTGRDFVQSARGWGEEFSPAPGSLPAMGLGARADPMGRTVPRAAAPAGLLQRWGPATPQLVLLKGVGAALAPHSADCRADRGPDTCWDGDAHEKDGQCPA